MSCVRIVKYIYIGVIMLHSIYMSALTFKTNREVSDKWRAYWCEKYGLEEAIALAIAQQESRIGKDLFRFEPHLVVRCSSNEWYHKHLTDEEREDKYSFYSLGDVHVLFGIAKSIGFKGKVHELMHPKENYKWGLLFFKSLCISEKYLDRAVSSYNQGKVSYRKNGETIIFKRRYIDENNNGIMDKWEKWKNQYYVNRVLSNYQKFGGKIKVDELIKE